MNEKIVFLTLAWAILCPNSKNAHYIQIDHNEFRSSGFPRPHVPPPLPPLVELAQHLPVRELTPVDVMVDLTNDMTFLLLHYHSILNRNNFAFSPTALMSILVALHEGSAGRSQMELRNVLQLPRERDVIRVGYRDIQRRLRTYFFDTENPLKGLSLNKDNVTISKAFETILMFYGYDLAMDMVSPTTTTTISNNTTENSTTPNPSMLTSNTSTDEEQKNATEIETTTTSSVLTTVTETTTVPQTTTEEVKASTESPTTETPSSTTVTETTTEEETTVATTSESSVTEAEDSGNSEAAELVSAFVAEEAAEPLLRIQKARVSRLPSAKLQAPTLSVTPRSNYLPSARKMAAPTRASRHKRHLFGLRDFDANLFVTVVNPHAVQHNGLPISAPIPSPPFAHLTNEYEIEVEPHFIGGSDTKQNYNTDVISHVFYLNNQQVIHTTFKVYNAVLYYKYFEHLKMNVLELELDTPEYNLMILLPDYHTDLVTAAASLRSGPTLRLMRQQLKPRWVQAIIPDFKLHGTIFLTNDLQNMGICDIFEPSRADLRPMTDEKGIYVKHIEQLINVTIRTHPINQLKRNYGSQTQPIQISVNHPFMFFIIDRDLNAAVMAGRILNPLNVRIQ